LAVVVDDAAAGITDIVRGRDIAPSTATQILIQRVLGIPTPRYRHHLLLLEPAKHDKLAKLHGSIPFSALRARHDGPTVCGILAHAIGLVGEPTPCTARSLIRGFDWIRVSATDRVAQFDDARGLAISSSAG
jgi:glutamyl-tRNA synthetase/glutamyl-Q tRNA(Asp) synthetase